MQTINFGKLREEMVERNLERRGVEDPKVLEAVLAVPREEFVAQDLVEFAYDDQPLPIAEGQTISQPYIVALMAEALELEPTDRVLEVGGGSGYAAAILGEIADEVYTIERHQELARSARERLRSLGYRNVHMVHGDGSRGLPGHAPFDAIVVAAGAAEPPPALLKQLAIGGRLVIPTGESPTNQRLRRIRRVAEDRYEEEELGDVRFVPLIGEGGWEDEDGNLRRALSSKPRQSLSDIITEAAVPFSSIEDANRDGLLERIGDSRLVLIGEASHGTAEFYDMRARITRELIEKRGFSIVAVEADWPDAAWLDHFARHSPVKMGRDMKPFTRFPTWMWANRSVLSFIHWLRRHNQGSDPSTAPGFYGLDLYSMYTSIDTVLNYLREVSPEDADAARRRYNCITAWGDDPAMYGHIVTSGRHQECEPEVLAVLEEMYEKQSDFVGADGHRYFDALQNARLVANAERYYRVMYHGSRQSWNLRDQHMFETLQGILEHRGPDSRAVIWAHNSHLGDARATEMAARGEHNLGQLCREEYGDEVYLIGFGTDHGTVAAAHDWGDEMEVMKVNPSHEESYERLCHNAGFDRFFLPLRTPRTSRIVEALSQERLERAIGVIYRPGTERASHYFYASLPDQFDEYIWLDETHALEPLRKEAGDGPGDTFPFAV